MQSNQIAPNGEFGKYINLGNFYQAYKQKQKPIMITENLSKDLRGRPKISPY